LFIATASRRSGPPDLGGLALAPAPIAQQAETIGILRAELAASEARQATLLARTAPESIEMATGRAIPDPFLCVHALATRRAGDRTARVAEVRPSKAVLVVAGAVALCVLTIASAGADFVGAAARFWGPP